MNWHEGIDNILARQSRIENNPADLALAEPLRHALRDVENSTTNRDTLHAVQCMAECAISPMVTDLINYQGDCSAVKLWNENNKWPTRDVVANTLLHSVLYRLHQRYSPYVAGGARPYELGNALNSAGELMRYAYPVNYDRPMNLDAQPFQGYMLDLVGYFAVTAQVHLTTCGPKKNQAAIGDLVANMADRI